AHVGRQVLARLIEAPLEPGHVAARREGPACSRDDQGTEPCSVREPGRGGHELADQLRAHRVQDLGAVQGHRADVAVDIDPDRLELGWCGYGNCGQWNSSGVWW